MNVVQTRFLHDPYAIAVFYKKDGSSATIIIYHLDEETEESINVRYAQEFC